MKIYCRLKHTLPPVGAFMVGFSIGETWMCTGTGYDDKPEYPGEACGWYYTVRTVRWVPPENRSRVDAGPRTL